MDNSNCSTEHKKYQHLTSEERHIIEVRINEDKWSIYRIAKSLGRPYNTIVIQFKRLTEKYPEGTFKPSGYISRLIFR